MSGEAGQDDDFGLRAAFAVEPPRTGDEAVDAALADLARGTAEPLETQVTIYDAVHRTLQDRLADVEG